MEITFAQSVDIGYKMIYRPILRTTVGIQSLALVGKATKFIPKKKKKPLRPKNLIDGIKDILIGTVLLKPTAKIVQTI